MTITLTREEAQQVLNALQSVWKMDRTVRHENVIETLRARLAQPEPSVDWKDMYEKERRLREAWTAKYEKDIRKIERAVLTSQPEPKPVAFAFRDSKWRLFGITTEYDRFAENIVPLYTAPVQREWQGLTDEEIDKVYALCGESSGYDYERAIEAKLREKNAP